MGIYFRNFSRKFYLNASSSWYSIVSRKTIFHFNHFLIHRPIITCNWSSWRDTETWYCTSNLIPTSWSYIYCIGSNVSLLIPYFCNHSGLNLTYSWAKIYWNLCIVTAGIISSPYDNIIYIWERKAKIMPATMTGHCIIATRIIL